MSAISVNNKYSNSRLQSIGTDLKNEAAIKSVIQLARLTETFTNEYTEVVRAYETGSAEEIDTVTLGRLYVDAANEFVSPNENRLRNIGLKAVKNIIKKAKEYETSNAGYRLNTIRDLIKGRAVELGADELSANKIADNITGKEIINEDIVNGEISEQIISELQQRENKQAEWVKRVNAVLQSVTKNTAQQEIGFANQEVSSDKGRQEGYNNYIDEDAFVEGLWDDGRNTTNNESTKSVENSQLENVENIGENGIIEKSDGKYDDFDINSLPEQLHHFATNKNLKYTPQFNKIVSKYGLNLNGDWNKQLMRHRGRHPNEYHEFILYHLNRIDGFANGNASLFISEFNNIKAYILNNPKMLRRVYWKGEHNEVLQYDLRWE